MLRRKLVMSSILITGITVEQTCAQNAGHKNVCICEAFLFISLGFLLYVTINNLIQQIISDIHSKIYLTVAHTKAAFSKTFSLRRDLTTNPQRIN